MHRRSELDILYFYFLLVVLMSPMSLVENITWFCLTRSPSPSSAFGNALLPCGFWRAEYQHSPPKPR